MEIILLWSFVIAWMAKRGAEDLVHAVKGTPNPRYEVKKRKALAAGKVAPAQPRYGSKDYAADFVSDLLKAKTEKRRELAKAQAQPVDDMIGLTREPKPAPAREERVYDPNNTRTCPDCRGEVVLDGRPCPRCLAEQQRRNAEWEARGGLDQAFGPSRTWSTPEEREAKLRGIQDLADEPEWLTPDPDEVSVLVKGRKLCPRCRVVLLDELSDGSTQCPNCKPSRSPEGREGKPMRQDGGEDDQLTGDDVIAGLLGLFPATQCPRCTKFIRVDAAGKPQCGCPLTNTPDTQPTARIYQFPNPKSIEKEISMSNPEATNLATAIAFAGQAATAHTSFATVGAEGYVGALTQGGNTGDVIDSAREAMEASGIAAEKWEVHKATLEAQQSVKEAYQGTPGAGDKEFLLNG